MWVDGSPPQDAGDSAAAGIAVAEEPSAAADRIPEDFNRNLCGLDPTWQVGNFFHMTEREEDQTKAALAMHLDVGYGSVNQHRPYAVGHAGIPAYLPSEIGAAQEEYQDLWRDGARPDLSEALVGNKAVRAVVVSGLLVRWRPVQALNTGYVLSWLDSNLRSWDVNVERRAGGLSQDSDLRAPHLATTNVCSLLALCAQIVHQFKTQPNIDPKLVDSFLRLRVSLYLGASAQEVNLLNADENVSQVERKRHTEMDNINVVRSWMTEMSSYPQLSPMSALDVFKFGAVLGDARRGLAAVPEWLGEELGNGQPTLEHRLKIVTAKGVTKKWLQNKKAAMSHPVVRDYDALYLRHRFLKGFEPVDQLFKELYCRMGREGHAAKQSPLTKAVLMDEKILSSRAFLGEVGPSLCPPVHEGSLSSDRLAPGLRGKGAGVAGRLGGRGPAANHGEGRSPPLLPLWFRVGQRRWADLQDRLPVGGFRQAATPHRDRPPRGVRSGGVLERRSVLLPAGILARRLRLGLWGDGLVLAGRPGGESSGPAAEAQGDVQAPLQAARLRLLQRVPHLPAALRSFRGQVEPPGRAGVGGLPGGHPLRARRGHHRETGLPPQAAL
jgi:hypothetical protein